MDKGKQQKNTEKKSYYGVFDPKAHQEAFEASLDKVYEETHEAQQKLQKLKERYKTTQNISKAKAKRTNIKLAKVKYSLTKKRNLIKLMIFLQMPTRNTDQHIS